MTGRLAGHDHAHRLWPTIEDPVLPAWADLDSMPRSQEKILLLNLHREFSLENKEELSRVIVGVPDFARFGGHVFFDDA